MIPVVMKTAKKKVFAAMSGGVDSSVAALLLKRKGCDVAGVFMRCWSGDASLGKLGINCAWERDSEDARRVAEKIGIPFYVWDFEEEYKKKVVDYMVRGYKQGLTPNPDVMCNREIKFGLFLERALRAGADYVATGHYVRLGRHAFRNRGSSRSSGEMPAASRSAGPRSGGPSPAELRELPQDKSASSLFALHIAKDKNKDQSYFLWTLTQKQLRRCLFPIGDHLKPEVREIARKAGLPTAEKKDSQGICFLGKVTLADFLKQYIPEKRGAVLDLAGAKLGEHGGAHFYTIGQRHIGIKRQVSGIKRSGDTRPLYVAEKNVRENVVVVAEGAENPALYRKEITLAEVNFTRPLPSLIRANRRIRSDTLRVFARVRYRQPLAPARLTLAGGKAELIFDKSQKFVAPGQSAVFYSRKGELLGGGVIGVIA